MNTEPPSRNQREKAASICEAMRPTGSRASCPDKEAVYVALTEAAKAIREATDVEENHRATESERRGNWNPNETQASATTRLCNCGRFPDPHEKRRLCGIGFNEFLGEVQHRLIKDGYNPPAWPNPTIRDQGDVDEALDSCVQWCKAILGTPERCIRKPLKSHSCVLCGQPVVEIFK